MLHKLLSINTILFFRFDSFLHICKYTYICICMYVYFIFVFLFDIFVLVLVNNTTQRNWTQIDLIQLKTLKMALWPFILLLLFYLLLLLWLLLLLLLVFVFFLFIIIFLYFSIMDDNMSVCTYIHMYKHIPYVCMYICMCI